MEEGVTHLAAHLAGKMGGGAGRPGGTSTLSCMGTLSSGPGQMQEWGPTEARASIIQRSQKAAFLCEIQSLCVSSVLKLKRISCGARRACLWAGPARARLLWAPNPGVRAPTRVTARLPPELGSMSPQFISSLLISLLPISGVPSAPTPRALPCCLQPPSSRPSSHPWPGLLQGGALCPHPPGPVLLSL